MSNWISSITNPRGKIIRKATSFSGSIANFYPWPVASVVTRLSVNGTVALATGPLLGTTIGTITSSATDPDLPHYGTNVNFDPQYISVSPTTNPEYNNADGVYILNPGNFNYLRVDFGTRIGPVDIYVEGYAANTESIVLTDNTRASKAQFNRFMIGSASAITSFIKNTTPQAWRATGDAADNSSVTNITAATHIYLSSTKQFSGFQVNLNGEGYARKLGYTAEYWNGSSWTSLTITGSTVCTWGTTDLVFHQSGIVTFTKPSDWAPVSMAGDPYVTASGQYDFSTSGTNYIFGPSLYYIRIVPPTPNSETVGIQSISIFN